MANLQKTKSISLTTTALQCFGEGVVDSTVAMLDTVPGAIGTVGRWMGADIDEKSILGGNYLTHRAVGSYARLVDMDKTAIEKDPNAALTCSAAGLTGSLATLAVPGGLAVKAFRTAAPGRFDHALRTATKVGVPTYGALEGVNLVGAFTPRHP